MTTKIREVLSEKMTFIRDLYKVGELADRYLGAGQAREDTEGARCEMGAEVVELRSSRASRSSNFIGFFKNVV